MKHKTSGFTMVELLVVIAIISILAGMLLPVIAKALDQARSVQCTSNLKQVGMMRDFYAEDYRNYIPGYTQMAEGEQLNWVRVLNRLGYRDPSLTGSAAELAIHNRYCIFLCPSNPPKIYLWQKTRSYGMYSGPSGSAGPLTPINTKKLPRPGAWFYYADSIRLSTGMQQHYVFYRNQSDRCVHLRHNGKANASYLDGGVRRVGLVELEEQEPGLEQCAYQ